MKTVKSLLEQYDYLANTKDDGMRQLSQLAQMGLLEENKLPLMERALNKNPDEMNMAEKRILVSMLESLTAHILSEASSSLKKYSSKIVPNASKPDEAPFKDHLATYDKRQNSDKNIPIIILLKRKALRVFPDNQKIGLYYSQALDKYVSIPFGPNEPLSYPMNEETLDEKTEKIWSRASKKEANKLFGNKSSFPKEKPQKEKDTEEKYLTPAQIQKSKEYDERDRKKFVQRNLTSRAPIKDLPDMPGGYAERMRRASQGGDHWDRTFQRVGGTIGYLGRKAIKSWMKKKSEPEVKPEAQAKETEAPAPAPVISKDELAAHDKKQAIRALLTKRKDDEALRKSAEYAKASWKRHTDARTARKEASTRDIKRSQPPPPARAGIAPVREATEETQSVQDRFAATKARIKKKHVEKKFPYGYDPKHPVKSLAKTFAPALGGIAPTFGAGAAVTGAAATSAAGRAIARIAASKAAKLKNVMTGAKKSGWKKWFGAGAVTGAAATSGNTSNDPENKGKAKSLKVPGSRGGKGVVTQSKRQTYDASEVQQQAQANKKLWPNMREDNFQIIKNMVENNIPKEELIFGDSSIPINSRLAKKIVKVYESLNRHNRQKVERMLNEDIGSFKKVIQFSVRA